MKRRKRASKNVPKNALFEPQTELLVTDTNGTDAGDLHHQQQGGLRSTKVSDPKKPDAHDNEQELIELELAVSSLRTKLEMLQPIGMRPSDLAAALEKPAVEDQDTDTDRDEDANTNAAPIANQEEILSQVSTSQCSVFLWDELRVLVTLSGSPAEKTREQVDKAVSELGLYNLEDGALDRICSEIFDAYQTEQQEGMSSDADDTRAPLQLSYPASHFLFRTLFHQKALLVQSKPSRLGQAALTAGEDNELSKVPVLFLTEVHLDTVKTILSYANVPTPLPSRLWVRFNAVLDILWDQIVLLAPTSSSSASCQALVKLYCSSGDLESFLTSSGQRDTLSSGGQESLRLSCVNLMQLLMTWTMRQGPLCQDVGNLERMRQFCASRMDVKQGRGLVTKLDMFIKRKSKK
ncbi:hypothetical protein BGZ75_006292 [Mortierella antarctica]|nr:hypothetical protein BGZ75_006292 [Mortierella antarctica]